MVFTELDRRELEDSCWGATAVLRMRGTEGLVAGYAAEPGLRSEREVALTAGQVPCY